MSLSESSVRMYESNLRILKAAGVNVLDASATIKWLSESGKAASTQKGYISSIQHFLKGHEGADLIRAAYKDEIRTLADGITEGLKKQTLSEKEKRKYEPWPVITGYAQQLLDDPIVSETDKLLCGLYCLMPPLRLDYANIRILTKAPDDTDSGNYIVIRNPISYVKINEHKTATKNGPLLGPIPYKLAKRFKLYLAANPGESVLWKMTEKSLSKKVAGLFRKYTTKNIGVSMLRHSYISAFLEKAPSYLQADALAKRMGHSVALQTYYRRLKPAEPLFVPDPDSDSE